MSNNELLEHVRAFNDSEEFAVIVESLKHELRKTGGERSIPKGELDTYARIVLITNLLFKEEGLELEDAIDLAQEGLDFIQFDRSLVREIINGINEDEDE